MLIVNIMLEVGLDYHTLGLLLHFLRVYSITGFALECLFM